MNLFVGQSLNLVLGSETYSCVGNPDSIPGAAPHLGTAHSNAIGTRSCRSPFQSVAANMGPAGAAWTPVISP